MSHGRPWPTGPLAVLALLVLIASLVAQLAR